MLSDLIKRALNEQVAAELYSSYLYLMLSWDFRLKYLEGFGHWFKLQAVEEMHHVKKITDHLLLEQASVQLRDIKVPSILWKAPKDALKLALAHEKMISERIRSLMSAARKESDFGTENLMSWFVSEQIEEEHSISEIYDKLEMIGSDSSGIILIDRELAKRGSMNPH